MKKYIPLDDLVAKIERWIELLTNEKSQESASQIDKLSLGGRIAELQEVKAFLDTIEVKEVDLDFHRFAEEMKTVFALPSSKTKNTEEEPLNWEYAIAKHFFELGMSVSNKAQKGE